MKFIACQQCGKKLLKIGNFDRLSVKCPRCKTLNHLSVQNAPSEAHEAQTDKDNPRGQRDTQAVFQSTPTIRGAKA